MTEALESRSRNNFSSFSSIILPQLQKANKLARRLVFFTLEAHSYWIFCPMVHGFEEMKNFDYVEYDT